MDFKAIVRAQLPPLSIAREPQIVDELAQHLSDLYDEARAEGLAHEEALARAVQALPEHSEVLGREIEAASRALPPAIARRWDRITDADPAVDAAAATRGWSMLADIRRDIRYALRMLARSPGFVIVTLVTLSLGIGANSAIFSAVNAILLRAAPIANPDRAATVFMISPDGRDRFGTGYSYPNYVDLRDSGAFEGLAAFAGITVAIDADGALEQISGDIVSGNYFDVLGVRPVRGRGFSADEDRPGSRFGS